MSSIVLNNNYVYNERITYLFHLWLKIVCNCISHNILYEILQSIKLYKSYK